MSLTKLDATKDFAFLNLISKEARDVVLKYGLVFQHEKNQVSITRDKETTSPHKFALALP